MNLMLLEPSEIDDQGRAVLRDRRAWHICRVLGAGPGDRLRAGVINGALGTAEVVGMTGSPAPDAAPTVELLVRLDEQTAPPVPGMELDVDVILAVPRPRVLARVLQIAACMGVRRVDLVNAWRVDKSHLASHELLPAALRHNLVLGCEQGGSTALPEIALHRLLMPFVRGPLGERLARGRARPIIAHPRAAMVLEQAVPPGTSESVILAIGPERGWIDREVETFTALGFAPVALGARVLRVEAAMTAALAQLELLRRL